MRGEAGRARRTAYHQAHAARAQVDEEPSTTKLFLAPHRGLAVGRDDNEVPVWVLHLGRGSPHFILFLRRCLVLSSMELLLIIREVLASVSRKGKVCIAWSEG